MRSITTPPFSIAITLRNFSASQPFTSQASMRKPLNNSWRTLITHVRPLDRRRRSYISPNPDISQGVDTWHGRTSDRTMIYDAHMPLFLQGCKTATVFLHI